MKKGWFIILCIVVFLLSAAGSILFKMNYNPSGNKYSVKWNESLGRTVLDLAYGEGEKHKFDLYLPADSAKSSYGLVVYLHPGGFTSGDKADDKEMLQWLTSKGYVSASINYTLRDAQNPTASVYDMSQEIKAAMPKVIEAAAKEGYIIDRMAVAGGSAGGTLALLYAYRDGAEAPVPLKMVFEAVGPASFHPEDWAVYGLDKSPEAAAALFGIMAGKEISPADILDGSYVEAVRNISPYLWINPESVPAVLAYGKHDKICPYPTVRHLLKALDDNGVEHTFVEFPHSGHGLQNDDAKYVEYMDAVEDYLGKYMQ